MTENTTDSDLLDEEAAGRYLGGIPAGTLKQWRYLSKGPAYSKLGKHVRYHRADLDAFVSAQQVDPSAA